MNYLISAVDGLLIQLSAVDGGVDKLPDISSRWVIDELPDISSRWGVGEQPAISSRWSC